MTRRAGATLVEVLVAIFVMAIGLIALLALFPVGAFQMATAIKDDRAAACAANATALATAWNLRHDPAVTLAFTNPSLPSPPNPATPPNPPTHLDLNGASPNIFPDWPSYPVFVDPVGVNSYALPSNSKWIAGLIFPTVPRTQYGIPRVSPIYVGASQALTLQYFSLTDEIQFDTNGTPKVVQAAVLPQNRVFERDLPYSWAYLLRRPRNGAASVVEMSVVVYQRRSLSLNSSTLGGNETYYNVTNYTPAYPATSATPPDANLPRTVQLAPPPGSPPAALRPGSWILDCTPGPQVRNPIPPRNQLNTPGNARFYRIVAVTDAIAGAIDVEVDQPILPLVNRTVSPYQYSAPSRFVVLENVVEVFDKGTTWLP